MSASAGGELFEFTSAYFGAGFNLGLQIEVAAYRDGLQVGSSLLTANSTSPAVFAAFSFGLIDQFFISSFGGTDDPSMGGGGTHFSMDNFSYDLAPIPLPASLPLMLAGLGGLGWIARRRKRS